MMKKIIALSLMTILLLSGFVVVGTVSFLNVKGDFEINAPYDTGNGNPPGDGVLENDPGDWIISWSASPDFIEYSDTTIILNGNLIIEPDAELILRNVTLKMNVGYDGEFEIRVQSAGTLRILDIDKDPLTKSDASNITSNSAFHFGFIVNGPSGILEMNNSELHESGWDSTESLSYQDGGLWIGSSNNVISNNLISNCYNGITVYGSSVFDVLIENNNISYCDGNGTLVKFANNVTINNNEYYENIRGIWFKNATNAVVTNNGFRVIYKYGAFFENTSKIDFSYNSLIDFPGFGGWLYAAVVITDGSSEIIVDNNILHDCSYSGVAVYNFNGGAEITNNSFDNPIKSNPFAVYDGDTAYFYGNSVGINSTPQPTDDGVAYLISYISGHVDLINNTAYNMPLFSFSGYGSGIYLNSVQSTTIQGNELNDNEGYGIYLYNSSNVLIKNTILNNNGIGISASDFVSNVLVENSTITAGVLSTLDFYLGTDSYITTLNTTFDNSSTAVNPSAELVCKWYLNVKAMQGGSGVNGANIFINDSKGALDPPLGQPFVTSNIDGEDGWVKWIPVTEFKESNNIKDYFTPHWINATFGVAEGFSIPNIWKSLDIVINLNGKPQVIDYMAPPYFVNRTEMIYFFANGTDFEDFESDFIVEFEYRDPNDLSWNTTFLGSFFYVDSNGNPGDDIGYWVVSFTPPINAPSGWYDIRVRFQDQSGSISNWYTLWDSVLVENSPPYVEDMFNVTFSTAPPGFLYRGDNAWIYGDGADLEDGDDQNFMDAEIQYRRPGEPSFGTHTFYWQPNSSSKNGGDWYMNFQTLASLDTPIGVYEFRMRFQDSEGTWGEWAYLENLTILNNPPQLIGFSKQNSSVYRGNIVRIYADCADTEDIEMDLTVHFYYRHAITGVLWEDAWFTVNGNWDGTDFYADFTPSFSAELGYYEFMVEITDHANLTLDGITIQVAPVGSEIEVLNNPPIPLNLKLSATTVTAGSGYIFLNVNATDFEDNESSLVVEAEYRYNETSPGSWSNVYLTPDTFDPSGWLRVRFEPDLAALLGHYDFRVKIQDLDGNYSETPQWLYIYRGAEVVEGGPEILDITPSVYEAFRGESFTLTINGTDSNNSENELTPFVQYRIDSGSWSILMGTFNYIDTNSNISDDIGYWEVQFTTDSSSTLGDYEFMGKVENTMNISSNLINSPWNVPVKNNPPITIDVIVSPDKIQILDIVYIHVNATDFEDLEQNLIIQRIEWRENNSASPGIPPTPSSWIVNSAKLSINLDEGYSIDHLKASISPTQNAYTGRYDIRVRVEDQNGGLSYFIYLHNAFEVEQGGIYLENIKLGKTNVFRGDTTFIFLNASDSSEDEGDLVVELEYKKLGSSEWTSISVLLGFYDDINKFWRIHFTPDLDWDDDMLGTYEFHARVRNSKSQYSNGGAWVKTTYNAEVKNNIPEALLLDNAADSIERGKSVTIYADGSDREKEEKDLLPIFEHSSDEVNWETHYFPDSSDWNEANQRWEIEFLPEMNAELGSYSFRVRFTDGLDYSTWIDLIDSLKVKNNIPQITEIIVPPIGYRQDAITLAVEVLDDDNPSENLTIIIEYKTSNGNWVSFNDMGGFFTENPRYEEGKWKIDFHPPISADLGDYNFRARISDGLNQSDWFTGADSLTLSKNPEDPDQDGILNVLDDDDDGDGIMDVDDPEPLIPHVPPKEEPEEFPYLLLIIIILLVIIILILLSNRRNKPKEELDTLDDIDSQITDEEILEDKTQDEINDLDDEMSDSEDESESA
jgi:parallel beta-helix repeat protein